MIQGGNISKHCLAMVAVVDHVQSYVSPYFHIFVYIIMIDVEVCDDMNRGQNVGVSLT